MKKENNKEKKVKNENKKRINGEKTIKCIKILTVVLLIVLISMIGFVGIYKEEKGDMKNTLKDYQTSIALNGKRSIKMTVKAEDNTNNTTSNTTENTTENSTSENGENTTNNVSNENKEDTNNTSNTSNETNTENSDKEKLKNYKKSKKVIEDRLKALNITEYTVSLNEKTGDIDIAIPEDSKTDNAVTVLTETGKFEIVDADTNEVLMNNDDIKSAKVMYGSSSSSSSSSSGTTVYLELEFNKNGREKLDKLSTTYVKSENNTTNDTNTTDGNTTNESTDGNTSTENNSTDSENTSTENATNDTNSTSSSNQTTTKNITMKIDDQTLMTTYFSEEIKNGKLDLTMGSSTSDESELQKTLSQAYNYAALLGNGELKNEYELDQNQYLLSNITQKELIIIACVVGTIALIGIIILIVKFKLNGLLSGIAYIGFAALCALILRYTNVIISLESLTAIVVGLILNYMFNWMLLKNIEKNKKDNIENPVSKACGKTYGKFFLDILPICFVSIVCCFVKWTPISSFGMTSFWSISLIAVYNAITYVLLNIKEND